MRNSLFAWVLLSWGVCALLAGVALSEGPDDLEQQQALYCEMVKTYTTTTGGEYGWPDYKGTARRDCR